MSFPTLPFDIHIQIARHLNLHDCLVYSQLSPLCYNVAYYVFAHRHILDFGSVLNNHHEIALSDTALLAILHAHTRATILANFCVGPHFSAYIALSSYLSLYWFNHDPADDIYTHGYVNGHIRSIECIGTFLGATNLAQSDLLDTIWNTFDTHHEYRVLIDSLQQSPYKAVTCNYTNWSSSDVDSPYKRCPHCLTAFPFSPQPVCDMCAFT